MNCQSFENNITDLARQAPLDATARTQAQAHATECASCASKLAEQRELSISLEELAAGVQAVAIPNRIEHELVAAFRNQKAAAPIVVRRRMWLPIAAAAMILTAITVVGLRVWTTTEVSPVAVSPPAPSIKPEAPSQSNETAQHDPVLVPVQTAGAQPPRKAVARRVKPVLSVRAMPVKPLPNIPNEVTTDFMTLSDFSTASLQEGAQVYRVELPRYAMARLGLPVNMERYDEKVKADVWIGSDGLPRAIRFVQ